MSYNTLQISLCLKAFYGPNLEMKIRFLQSEKVEEKNGLGI